MEIDGPAPSMPSETSDAVGDELSGPSGGFPSSPRGTGSAEPDPACRTIDPLSPAPDQGARTALTAWRRGPPAMRKSR